MKYFTFNELFRSDTALKMGIDNIPDSPEIRENLLKLGETILDPIRERWKNPIRVTSGYRCKELNKAVGGVSNSQHTNGQAADLCIDGDMQKGKRWFEWIKSHCDFDQLIWEHNAKGSYWVHVSYRADGRNRKQVINNLLKK